MSGILKADSRTFILSLPQGKPNTKIPLENGDTDNRTRVVQSPQKGPNCAFYAMNILRKRIGANPGSDHTEARRIEKLCSEFYKSRTVLHKNVIIFLPNILQELSRKGYLTNFTRSTIKNSMDQIRRILHEHSGKGSNFLGVIPYLEAFCEQVEIDDIHAYLEQTYTISNRGNFLEFLENMGISPQEQYEQNVQAEVHKMLEDKKLDTKMVGFITSVYPKLDDLTKTSPHVLHTLAGNAASEAFGFKVSKWTPLQSIDKLQECLKSEGALMVSGLFGESLYSNDPFESQRIEGRPIYSWKASDRRESDLPFQQVEHHSIVVIGAAKGGTKGGFVYFVDPMDGSDPQNPLQQKIYMISYENFTTNIIDITGKPPKGSYNGFAEFYPRQEQLDQEKS